MSKGKAFWILNEATDGWTQFHLKILDVSTKGQCDTALGVTNDLRLENEQEVIFIVGNNKPLNLKV